jgi:hypothetical protein
VVRKRWKSENKCEYYVNPAINSAQAMTAIPIFAGYRRAILDSLVLQVILGLLAMMVLDGGRIAHTTGIAVLAFWIGATVVILRRPKSPTDWDLFLIRFGFLPLLTLTFALAEWVWSWQWVWKIRGL